MRAKDIEAGTEYLWSNSSQWANGGYANIARVRVEDAQTVYAARNYRDDVTDTIPISPGDRRYSKATVKTVLLNRVTGEVLDDGKPFYARPTDLRGPWTEADAKRKAARQVKQDAAYAAAQQRQAAEDRADGLRERALDLGVTVQPQRVQGTTDRYTYNLTDTDLTKLLDRLAATSAGKPAPLSSWPDPDARPTY